jgi:predicted Abi (CAAX) family protease
MNMTKLDQLIDIFNKISFTNVRILVTTILASGTAVTYWLSFWAAAERAALTGGTASPMPIDNNWLIFLGALGGIDVMQYVSKSSRQKQVDVARIQSAGAAVEEAGFGGVGGTVTEFARAGGVGGTVTEFSRAEAVADTDVSRIVPPTKG